MAMVRAGIMTRAAVVIVAGTCVSLSACDDGHDKVVGSVHVHPGDHADSATTVNGSVDIGANAVVRHADTVNGSITVHPHATVDYVDTVNGSVDVEEGARVTGNVSLVNGNIRLAKEAEVNGDLTTVNGSIELTAAHVHGSIKSTASDLDVGAYSRVDGGIDYERSNASSISFGTPRLPRVVVGPGATVTGPLQFRRAVKLYVSDRATVGPVEGATINIFNGDRP
jgi:cytoskeletal protein CcmA (bactofilin family)